ncbi:MAG: hypothetical protein QM755_10740 [Luteolibacter sp.]
MKFPWKKKWLRRFGQAVLVAVSLLLLAAVILNWWGARKRNQIARELQSEGLPIAVSGLLAPLPPDELNFGKVPSIALADSLACVQPWENREVVAAQKLFIGMDIGLPPDTTKPAREQDFRRWMAQDQRRGFTTGPRPPKAGEIVDPVVDAAAFLKDYDTKYADVLTVLREAISRPLSQSSWLQDHISDRDWNLPFEGNSNVVWKRTAVRGMMFRGYGGVVAGEPESALESLEIGYRMTEWHVSEGSLMPVVVGMCNLGDLRGVLKAGLQGGIWNKNQITRLETLLARIDMVKAARNALLLENAIQLSGIDYLQQRPAQLPVYWNGYPMTLQVWSRKWMIGQACRLIPRGWFDANAARLLEEHRLRMASFDEPGILARWWRGCEEMAGTPITDMGEGRSRQGNYLELPPWSPSYGLFFRLVASTTVSVRQARLACALERYRLDHDRYPASLDEIGGELIVDPANGRPFRYEIGSSGYHLYSVGPDGGNTAGTPPSGIVSNGVW